MSLTQILAKKTVFGQALFTKRKPGSDSHHTWRLARDPFDTAWSMHIWQGVVETMLPPGDWLQHRTCGIWRDLWTLPLNPRPSGFCRPTLRAGEVLYCGVLRLKIY